MESFPITENFSNHRPSFCREQPDFGRTLVLQGFLHLLPQQQEILGICANWKSFKIFLNFSCASSLMDGTSRNCGKVVLFLFLPQQYVVIGYKKKSFWRLPVEFFSS